MRSLVPLLLATLFLTGAPVLAGESSSPVLSRIVSGGTLRVGMSGNQPPLNFKSKDGTMMGLEVDLANAMADLMRVELEIVQKPFGQLLATLEKGDVDLVMSGMTITPERNLRAAFVGPYYLSGKSILTRSTSLATADDAEDLDLANLKLAALAGSTSEEFVKTFLPKATLVATSNYDEAVAALLGGDVQAVVADQEIVALTAFLHPKENLATLKRPLTVEPIGIAARAGDAQLLNFLENTLGALEASGILDALRGRWFQEGDWVQELP